MYCVDMVEITKLIIKFNQIEEEAMARVTREREEAEERRQRLEMQQRRIQEQEERKKYIYMSG